MADTIRRVYEIDAKIATTAIQSLREIQRNLRDVETSARAAGKGTKEAAKDIEESSSAFSHLTFNTVGARRELLVLFHELSQGNIKAFGGSLLVLGERIDATRLIMSAAGLTTIAFVAAVVALGFAVAHGAIEQDKFNKSLQITGNAAGATNDSLDTLAKGVAGATGATVRSVEQLAKALISTGEVGPESLGALTLAMSRVQRLTKETTDEVAARFKNFAVEPTKAALELNKTFNFLDSSTFQYIKRLDDLGDRQTAAVVAADALSTALYDRQAPKLGAAAAIVQGFSHDLDVMLRFFNSIDAEDTFEHKIERLTTKIGELEKKANNPSLITKLGQFLFFGGNPGSATEQEIGGAQAELEAAKAQKRAAEDKARQDAADALTKREAVNAQIRINTLDDQTKGADRLGRALQKLKEDEAAIVKDRQRTQPDFQIDPADHARREAEIRRQNRTQGDKSLENAITSRLRSLGEEDAQLKEQIKQYDEYGKKVNNAARAKVDFDLKSGNLRGAGPDTAAKLRAAADLVDADRLIVHQKQAESQADRRIEQLRTEAEARSTNAREIQIAIELGKLETDGLVKGTPAYEKRATVIRDLTNQIHDNALARRLSAQEDAAADEARSITDQIALIGQSTLERDKYNATLRITRQVTKELAENPDNAFEIIASATRQIDIMTEALDKNYAAQRKFESGAKTAFSTYVEEATNGAKFSNSIISGSLKQVEDLFVNFAKTGKLNFKDLFTYMADEFIRQSVRMSISGILKEGGAEGAITSAFKSLAGVFGINFESGAGAAKGAAGALGATASDTALTSLAATSTTAAASMGVLDGSLIAADVGITSLTLAASAAATALLAVAGSSGASGVGSALGSVDWSSVWGGALGGIMSSHGALPLNTYAGGGIANSPQMAIFGEGRMNEAYVPLPDGRSIPVTMKSNDVSGGSNAPLNVTIENHNNSDVGVKRQKNAFGQEELRVVIKAAKQEMLDDIYGGGDFDKALTDKYNLNRGGGTPRSGR